MDKKEIKLYLENLLKNIEKFIESKLTTMGNDIKKREEYYVLKNSIELFLNDDETNRFFIMSGIRGIGKTTILYQLYDYLKSEKNVPSRNILYLNLNRLRDLGEYEICDFFNVYKNDFGFKKDEKIVIFVDESQYLDNLNSVENWINSDENKNIFIIFAGSNVISYELDSNSLEDTIIKMYPLNFIEYLNLNYNYTISLDVKKDLKNLILEGETGSLEEIPLNPYIKKHKDEWMNHIQYSSFPNLAQNNILQISSTLDIKNEIIEKDLDSISSFTRLSRLLAYPLLNLLVMEDIKDLALNKLATTLNISKKNVSNLLFAFENIQILFHVEPYVSSGKSVRKAWKYFFISTQFKSAIYQISKDISINYEEYYDSIAKNLVASALFKLKDNNYNLYYDATVDGVEFIVKSNEKIVPIDVNSNEDKLNKAIEEYDAEYGILVIDNLSNIKIKNKIIYIPLSLFSLI